MSGARLHAGCALAAAMRHLMSGMLLDQALGVFGDGFGGCVIAVAGGLFLLVLVRHAWSFRGWPRHRTVRDGPAFRVGLHSPTAMPSNRPVVLRDGLTDQD